MGTQVYVKELVVGNEKLLLLLKDQVPVAEWKNEHFTNLWLLVAKFPMLSEMNHLADFSEVSNFFWKGLQFRFIQSILEYQIHYKQRVELERQYPADVFEYRLTDYKIFDVDRMHEPKVENDQLVYFVCNVSTGLPYRVVCPFPYPLTSTLIHYQVLPILDT